MDTNIKGSSLIAQKIEEGGKNVAFTGAGISTESGISDFRSKGGIWDKYKPVYFDKFMSSREARVEYWQRKAEFYDQLVQAKPNPAHRALYSLYEMGLLEAVITQNIDGLHQESGIPDDRVIELHGNNRRVVFEAGYYFIWPGNACRGDGKSDGIIRNLQFLFGCRINIACSTGCTNAVLC